MKWQRAARWGVAVAGLGVAVLLYTQTRERPAGRPPAATPADPEVRAQSSAGTVVRFSDGEQTFELRHEGERVFADGRTEWDKAQVTIGDGTLLSADLISSSGDAERGEPADLHFRGRVMLDTPEGASVRADEATYNRATGVAILPGPVAFTRGRVSGSGTNGEYHRETGVFTLESDARIEMASDEASGTINGSAQTMTFNRATAALLLDGGARIDHQRQAMSAERATLYMTEDQEQVRVIELRTNARVDPKPGHEAEVPVMHARDIDLAFYEGTEQLERGVLVGGARMTLVEESGPRTIEAADIQFGTAADGRTLTHLEAHRDVVVRTPVSGESPARTITSRDLVAAGEDGKGLTSAVFTGGVTFVESRADSQKRTGSGNRLTMILGGRLEAVERAHFEGNARFTDGEVTGDADLGDYDAAGGRLTLRPASSPTRLPRVESGAVTVDAATAIDVDLDSRDLHAQGDVRTVSQGEAGTGEAAGADAGFFTSDETMYGFGDEFWYVDGTGEARYRGSPDRPARVTQGETSVTAVTIRLDREGEDLDAETGVVATFVTSGAEGAAPATHRVESQTLAYRGEARIATYTGKPVVMTGPDGETTADTMVMTLTAGGSREVERLDAEGNVHSTLVDGSVALADALVYEAGPGQYTLRGEPLILRMIDEENGSCSETRGRLAYYTVGEPSPEFPAAENRGRVVRRNVACDAPLER